MQKEGSEVNTQEKSLETISRQEVEDFLYKEGYLLDEWQLDKWLSLFTPDAQYVVPTNDLPTADPENDLVYIDHDFDRIKAWTVRLKNSMAHREYPWSNTVHMVTNVRLLGVERSSFPPHLSCGASVSKIPSILPGTTVTPCNWLTGS
jgi:p-cumate 2,3-dioxygenase subunit beta